MAQIKTRNAQAEIMGLMVIVVLVTLGFFFAVSLRSNIKTSDIQSDYTDKQLSTTFIIALLQTNIKDCPEYNVEDLIIDCATGENIECNWVGSCDMLETTLNEITDKSLIKWNSAFNLSVWDNEDNIIYTRAQNCGRGSTRIRTGIQPVQLYPVPGNAKFTLTICKQ
ncbi:hypothetical protein JW949_01125 [Candidatus Woesearchaeota archaeon]|nr:hypothetical protein [Candidatus Woesearchaeota archaeon]